MRKLALAACVLLLALAVAPALKAQTIVNWTFDNDAIASPVPSPAPLTNITVSGSAGALASAIGMTGAFISGSGNSTPDVAAGATSDTGTNGLADTSHIWRIRASGGTGTNNGWSSQAPIGSQGAQFNVDTSTFNNPLLVSFDWYSTTQGEANLQFEYTTTGSNWINLPVTIPAADTGASLVNNSGGAQANTVQGYYVNGTTVGGNIDQNVGQDWFPNLSVSITDPNAQNDSNFAFRLVNATTGAADVSMTGSALNNTSGNWRFDNVSIQAVPEPAAWAMTLAGLGFLGGLVKLRSRHRSS